MAESLNDQVPDVPEVPEVPENQEDGDICSICRSEFTIDDPAMKTPCGHEFHFQCLMQMMRNSNLCAICRKSLIEGDYVNNNEEEDVEIDVSSMEGMIGTTLLSVIRERVNITMSDEDAAFIENRSSEYHLFLSCESGDLNSVRDILREGANSDMVHSEDDECNTLVHAAILSDNQSLLKYLLIDMNLGTNTPNLYRMSPLHIAAMAKYRDMARILLNHGANIDQQDASGRTSLIISCQKNDVDTTNLLLDHNASIRSFDINGDSAIHHACRGRCSSILRALLTSDNVKNIDSTNLFGETALHVACNSGSTSCVRILLQYEADSTIKSKSGKKAIEEISERDPNRTRLLALLRD